MINPVEQIVTARRRLKQVAALRAGLALAIPALTALVLAATLHAIGAATWERIGYTLARTNIQSCDFSSGSYSYVGDNDPQLKTFSVAHDEQYRIPLIKQAIAAAGGHLRLFVSPWSPPAWMKDNNSVTGGGHLKP